MLEGEHARLLVERAYTDITQGELVDTYARSARGERVALRVLGIDALSIAAMAPTLLPRPAQGESAFAALDPQRAPAAVPCNRALARLLDG